MNSIPILNIQQFEQEKQLENFYSNDLSKHLKKNEAFFHKPHKHNFFLCVLFTEGSGIHEIDFNSYDVQPGTVFFLKPGQTHFWKFDSAPKGYIFFHSQDFYNLVFSKSKLEQYSFYYSYKNPPFLLLKNKDIPPIAKYFEEINNEYSDSLPFKNQKIASLLNITYIELSRHYNSVGAHQKTVSTTYLKTLQALQGAIEEFYKTEKSAAFYANLLHITPKHLNRITKTSLNKTTTELITERVLLEAKRLIVHSNNSLSVAAETLGFDDYAYFSKLFKSKTNKTPLEFRKGYQKF